MTSSAILTADFLFGFNLGLLGNPLIILLVTLVLFLILSRALRTSQKLREESIKNLSGTTLQEAELNPSSDAECYLLRGDQQSGPFTPGQIRSMWNAGSITSDTLFYDDKMVEWRPVKFFCLNEKTVSLSAPDVMQQMLKAQEETAFGVLRLHRMRFILFVVVPLIYWLMRVNW